MSGNMEKIRLLKDMLDGFLESLASNGVFDDFEAMEKDAIQFFAGDGSEFKKPMQRFSRKKSRMNSSIVHDDCDSSLMPAPMGRPLRKRTSNKKSTVHPKSSRATRSSKLSHTIREEPDEESEPATKKTRRTRQINKESVIPEAQPTADTSSLLLSETDVPVDSGDQKARRTTRKRNTTQNGKSSRITRASYRSRVSGIGTRKSSVGGESKSKKASMVLESSIAPVGRMTRSKVLSETITISSPPNKRTTRSQAIDAKENWKVVDIDIDEGVKTSEPKIPPSGPNSVKQRVKKFEELTGLNIVKNGVRPGSPFVCSPAPKKAKATADSPIVMGKTNVSEDENKTPLNLGTKDFEMIEEEEEPANRTFQVVKPEGMKKGKDEVVTDKQNSSFDEVLDADDEWVSDEEEASSKMKKASSSKRAKAPVLSAKALRSKKEQKISADIAISSTTKNKAGESDAKEIELKKKLEKEEDARKRKEELMKKKTEAMKKKREEKMEKVKRTREKMEKDVRITKAKKGRGRKGKEEEKIEEVKSPLATHKTPTKPLMATTIANSTFNVSNTNENAVNSYDLTPCWQDVPPVQPDNPNDYGVADQSGCSSEEENDPRKTVPDWAKIGPNHPKHLSQALLSQEWISTYWNSKPRKPTISQLFNQVSKRTLKRGLNYRTSSACWNTPPLRK